MDVMSFTMVATKESRLKQRAVIELLNFEGVNQTEIVQKLKMYKEDAVDQSNVRRCLKRLRDDISQENDDGNVIAPCKFLDDFI